MLQYIAYITTLISFSLILTKMYKTIIAPYFKKLKLEKQKLKQDEIDFKQMLTQKLINVDTLSKDICEIKDSVNTKFITIENALKNVEDTQRIFLDIQKLSFWYASKNGKWIKVSSALCRLIGYSEEDLLGNSWLNTIDKEDRVRVEEAWERSIELEVPFDEIFKIRRSDNAIINVEAIAFHKKNEKGIIGRMELYLH